MGYDGPYVIQYVADKSRSILKAVKGEDKSSSIHLFDSIQCHHQTNITKIYELSWQHHDQSEEITTNLTTTTLTTCLLHWKWPLTLILTYSIRSSIPTSKYIDKWYTGGYNWPTKQPYVASTATYYESVFLQQIKCSKSRLLMEVGTILGTLRGWNGLSIVLCASYRVFVDGATNRCKGLWRVQGMMEELRWVE